MFKRDYFGTIFEVTTVFSIQKDINSNYREEQQKPRRMSYLIQEMDELHNVEMYVSIYVDVQMQTCQYINTNSECKKGPLSTQQRSVKSNVGDTKYFFSFLLPCASRV